ncbi:hypothetical protein CEXT_686721 [Caerostris extrusa]|uniref:Uncharacterized protein n=1 Tax=Caerostris extrusa TaxID=172846 RepID=A0AAV4QSP1_CAEEX|nr:hypothetical protein CEXT_686721 [Caerostris extrusa]
MFRDTPLNRSARRELWKYHMGLERALRRREHRPVARNGAQLSPAVAQRPRRFGSPAELIPSNIVFLEQGHKRHAMSFTSH